MKKASVLFLTLLFLVSNTEFHELLKVPSLVIHFMEHKSENPNITLAQYFAIHYNSKTVHDDDYDRDQQLPFKTVEHLQSSVTVFISYFSIKLPIPHFNNNVELPFYWASFISFQLLSNIWQPPRF